MAQKEYVKELATKSVNLVELNYSQIKTCFDRVFSDKNLCRQLDLNNWPLGKNNNRAEETIKTLLYLFQKLYLTYTDCEDQLASCIYCDAINKYYSLIKLTQNICSDIQTLDLLKSLSSKLSKIQKLGICKCKLHIKYFVDESNKKKVKTAKHKSKNKNIKHDKREKSNYSSFSSNNEIKSMVDTKSVVSEDLKSIFERIETNLKKNNTSKTPKTFLKFSNKVNQNKNKYTDDIAFKQQKEDDQLKMYNKNKYTDDVVFKQQKEVNQVKDGYNNQNNIILDKINQTDVDIGEIEPLIQGIIDKIELVEKISLPEYRQCFCLRCSKIINGFNNVNIQETMQENRVPVICADCYLVTLKECSSIIEQT